MSNELVMEGVAAATPFFLLLPIDGVLIIPTITDADTHGVGMAEELTRVRGDAIATERHIGERKACDG